MLFLFASCFLLSGLAFGLAFGFLAFEHRGLFGLGFGFGLVLAFGFRLFAFGFDFWLFWRWTIEVGILGIEAFSLVCN